VVAPEVGSLSRSTTASSSSDRARGREEEKSFENDFSKDAKQASRVALAELAKRKRPNRPPLVDERLVAVAARCAEHVDGDVDAKLRALRLAIEGAYATSSGPPSVHYIFRDLDTFDTHVWRAESRARALERKAHSPPRECIARPIYEPIDTAVALEELAKIDAELAKLGVGT
jgi:hypothetical protein